MKQIKLSLITIGLAACITMVFSQSTESKLKVLDISHTEINKLPERLKNDTKLKKLNISNNKLIKIPNWIGTLTNLEYLNIGQQDNDFDLASLKNLASLKKIRILNLSNQYLQQIPNWLYKLKNLEQLMMIQCGLTSISSPITLPDKLNALYLDYNQISKIDSLPNSLEHLYLPNNLLTHVPITIGKLVNLKNLNLSSNKLKRFPNNLKDLKNLRRLNLSHNMLDTTNFSSSEFVIKTIPGLTNLNYLDLSYNGYVGLNQIGDLKRVERIRPGKRYYEDDRATFSKDVKTQIIP